MSQIVSEAILPRKSLKMRLGVFLILILIITFIFIFVRREKTIAGRVVDCNTNYPIAGVGVLVDQVGWGFDGSLVWDKHYLYSAKTDESGYFKIRYKVGDSVNITAQKDGYIKAQQFEYSRDDILIKLLSGYKPAEVTYNCKLSSQCYATTTENGIEVIRDICL